MEAQQTLAKLLAAEPLSETSHAWRIFLGMMILKVFVVEDIDVDVWYWIGLVELSIYCIFWLMISRIDGVLSAHVCT